MLSPLEEQLRRKGPRGEMNPYKCNGRQKQAALCCSAPPYEKESVIILAQQAVLGNLASIKKENEQYQRIGDPFLNWCGLPPPLAHPLWVSDWLFIGRKLIHLNLLAKLVCIKCKSIQTLFITSKFANCQLPKFLFIPVLYQERSNELEHQI